MLGGLKPITQVPTLGLRSQDAMILEEQTSNPLTYFDQNDELIH